MFANGNFSAGVLTFLLQGSYNAINTGRGEIYVLDQPLTKASYLGPVVARNKETALSPSELVKELNLNGRGEESI